VLMCTGLNRIRVYTVVGFATITKVVKPLVSITRELVCVYVCVCVCVCVYIYIYM
jgi:hypothetical protein